MSPRYPACICPSAVCILCNGTADWTPAHTLSATGASGSSFACIFSSPDHSPSAADRGGERENREDGFSSESQSPNRPRLIEINLCASVFCMWGVCEPTWHGAPVPSAPWERHHLGIIEAYNCMGTCLT